MFLTVLSRLDPGVLPWLIDEKGLQLASSRDAKLRKRGGEVMKLLISSMFSVAVLASTGITATDALAIPGNTNNNGNHYGWYKDNDNVGNNGNRSVPIPDTLLLFGGSIAGLIGWQWMVGRGRGDDTS
jgi:hypothetical protein